MGRGRWAGPPAARARPARAQLPPCPCDHGYHGQLVPWAQTRDPGPGSRGQARAFLSPRQRAQTRFCLPCVSVTTAVTRLSSPWACVSERRERAHAEAWAPAFTAVRTVRAAERKHPQVLPPPKGETMQGGPSSGEPRGEVAESAVDSQSSLDGGRRGVFRKRS